MAVVQIAVILMLILVVMALFEKCIAHKMTPEFKVWQKKNGAYYNNKDLINVPLNYGMSNKPGTVKPDGVQIIGKSGGVLYQLDLRKDYIFFFQGNVIIIIREGKNSVFLEDDIKKIGVQICNAPNYLEYVEANENKKWNYVLVKQ